MSHEAALAVTLTQTAALGRMRQRWGSTVAVAERNDPIGSPELGRAAAG